MAEFKLGRIRFVWKGDWSASTTYYVDDVIRYGGKTFICVDGHTSDSDFYTDLDRVPSRWNQMSDGFQWRGDWQTSTFYSINDLVKYGGQVYAAKDSHTSSSTTALGLENDLIANWDEFAEGFDWKGTWTTATRYKLNDIVKYGGTTYVCNTGHTSASTATDGLEIDQAKWDYFNQGIEYKGTWNGSSTRYKVNDVVKYGSSLWICTTKHTSTAIFANDSANWSQFVEGFEFENDWNSGTTYQPGDIVRYGGNQYVSKTNHSNSNPITGTANWDLFLEGFRFESDWAINTSYKIGSVVRLNGYTYLAIGDSPSTSLTVTSANSINNRLTVNDTTGLVAGMAIVFAGTSFGDINVGATYYVKTIDSATTITITEEYGGTVITPSTATGTMTANVSAMPPHTTYWSRLSSGIRWQGEWIDDTQYLEGDAIRYGANAYICIKAHRSDAEDSTIRAEGGGSGYSRPDQANAGTYWNLLSIGSETTVLTTQGDLVYYGGAGPTRLPIGIEGQVLRVSSTETPEWVSLGQVENVYYVSPTGTDGPAPVHGITLDKAWASIRYACEQVEIGPKNPNAKRLLEMNREFIAREVTEWIDYQVEYYTNTAPDALSMWYQFDYDEHKCERDTGIIIDGLIHDLGKGGNIKIRSAALTYINALADESFATDFDENGTGTFTKLLDEGPQDIAAFNYMLTLAEKVLNQEAPTVNYQVANGDNSTAVVEQWTDSEIAAESTAMPRVTELVNIVITALTDGDATNIPARLDPTGVIYVKTGIYKEVLPIIVPAGYCILGDEVRSSVAEPQISVIEAEDAPYTIKSIGRMTEVVSDIISGTTVTASTGNGQSQDIAVPFADTVEQSSIEQLGRVLQHRIDWQLGTMEMAEYPDPTDYNFAYLTDYGYGRELISLNKEYLKTEVTAWITANYPTLKYSKTSCQRDIGYICDALIYDLTYGGNAQSIIAGRAYYEGVGSSLFIDSTELAATAGAYAFMKSRLISIFGNVVAVPLQTTVAQVTTSTTPAGAVSTAMQGLMDDIIAIISGGHNGSDTVTIVSVSSNVCTTSSAHGLSIGDTFTPQADAIATGLRANKTYYVRASAASNTFELSESWGGSAVTLSNGTGLSIVGNVVNNPAYAWTSSAMQTAYATLSTAVSEIQTDAIDYINSTYGSFTYNSALCRRDSEYLVDAGYYDAAFGSNFWAVQNGLSYLRTQAGGVTTSQLAQELKAILNIKNSVAASLASNSTAVTRSNAAYVEIADIINNGASAANALVYTDAGNPSSNNTIAREELVNNRAFIISEMSSWFSINESATWTAIGVAGQATCERDIGYLIDALAYDAQYDTNIATLNVARSLFNNITGAAIQPAAQKTASANGYTQLGVIVEQIVQGSYGGQDATAGDAGATIGQDMQDLCDEIAAVVTAGSLSGLVAESLPSISWVDADIQTALTQLAWDKTSIVEETLQSITDEFSSFSYNHAKCSRDIGIIIDAMGYDMLFDANYQTLKAAYSYLRASASEVFDLNQKDASRATYDLVRDAALANVGGDATAQAKLTVLFQLLDDILFGATTQGSTCLTNERNAHYAALQLERNRDFIVAEVSAWMNYNYVNFDSYYNSTTCARDIGMIIDAASYDLVTGSNFASSVAGMAYYRVQSALVTGGQLIQTVAAVKKAKELSMAYINAAEYSEVAAAFDNILDILQGGLSVVPTYTWPDNGTSDATSVADAAALQTNRATIVSGVTTYLSSTAPYNTVWAGLTAAQQADCARDTGYIIDALTYDVQYGGNYQTVIAGDAYYSFGTLQIGSGEKAATIAAYTQLGTLAKAYTSATGDTAIDGLVTNLTDIINNGAGTVATTYPSESGESASVQTSYSGLQSNKSTMQSAVTTYITDTFSSYTYDVSMCERDVNKFIDAFKFDLKYPGNYETFMAARYYANAVIGSHEEDFFYLRDGTGLRNMTLQGLNGDLTPENAYGTSRVTAGAYASLDPGWGPGDFRTWILARSPYMQNCACFGYAAIGQKVDGALHNGGNKSMVSNDFTQLISDGIGAWITNNGRAELVSVFTYYSHVGYLAENGGRIRGTNGNNSYGDWGSVAEGFDDTETPNTAIVDNRTGFEATIGEVLTDGDKILAFEFDNAGNDYTEASWILTGGGTGASVETDEIRDDAVFQVRLLDLEDDSSGQYGGDGYLTNANTAQGGNSTSITLAAVEQTLSTGYVGMKVYLTAGSGAGQYGVIQSYNAGTKLASVVRESDGVAGWDHVVPGTDIVNPDASTTYVTEPAISFTAPSFSSEIKTMPSTGIWRDAAYGHTVGSYASLTADTYNGNGTGATFAVVRNGTKYASVILTSGGTGYVRSETITLDGSNLGGDSVTNDITITITSVNSVSGEILEFDHEGVGIGGVFVAVKESSNAGAYSKDGDNWTAMTLPTSATWSSVAHGLIDDGSSTAKISRFVAISESSNAAWSANGVTWTPSTLPASVTWVSVAYGNGRFVAIASNSTTVAVSLDGEVWDITGTLPGTGYTDIAYGQGKFVVVSTASDAAAFSTTGVAWTASTLPASANWSSVAYGNNMFVAVASNSNDGAISADGGATWNAITVGSLDGSSTAGYQKVRYGQGVFLATAWITGLTGYTYVAQSDNGTVWTTKGVEGSGAGFRAVAFGNSNQVGYWITINRDSSNGAARIRTGARARGRAFVSQEKIFAVRLLEPGSGYDTIPTMTITDPNNIYELPFAVRIGKGALGIPSFISRGAGYVSSNAEIDQGDGYADFFQSGQYIAVRRLSSRPVPGSNVVFSHLPNRTFKLVNVLTFLGTNDGAYTAFFQISPDMTVNEAPEDGTTLSTRIRYSQVRLTGHDFLDIGTGSFVETNYPNTPLQDPVPVQETNEGNGGRVFFTATDQDGNFRVGDLFAVEQSTGIATLNADAFNIAGLQELTLGEVSLGGGSASISEFSTDPFFTADSDTIVPTQRAIKAYIASQIGGGGASLNVNSVTAGAVYVGTNQITTTSGAVIAMRGKFRFEGSVTGYPLAWNYFL